jgi:hypothetical protein
MVVLPRMGEGAVEVVVSLEGRPMEVLMGDQVFRGFVVW